MYLKNKEAVVLTPEEQLPSTLTELEMAYKQLDLTSLKLRESTDLLTEEFRKVSGEEARELYGYIHENLEILKDKADQMKLIDKKVQSIKGVFGKDTGASTGSGAGGLMSSDDSIEGHYI